MLAPFMYNTVHCVYSRGVEGFKAISSVTGDGTGCPSNRSPTLELKCSGPLQLPHGDILSVLFHIYTMGLMTCPTNLPVAYGK